MKLLVACDLPDEALQQLRSLAEVVHEPGATADRIRALMAGVGILVARGQRVGRDIIHASPTLQMIIHAEEGPGEIAVEEASVHGVFVTHCPDRYADSVCELAIGLMVALDRGLVSHAQAMREGRWERGELRHANGLHGRCLGLLGYDADGRCVAQAAREFGMRVLVWSPNLQTRFDDLPDLEPRSFPIELAQHADIICVCHFPSGEHMPVVDRAFVEAMPPGAMLIHVGNPQAVDEVALARAVRERGLRVALDRFQSEPTVDSARLRQDLLTLPGVLATPAIGRVTRQAKLAVANEVVNIARRFLVGGETVNCINLLERSPATWQLVLRVRDQVGVMAAILDAIRADGVNAEEITSRVFTGAKAAWCAISLDERPSREAMESIRRIPDVMHLELRAMV